MSLDDEVVMDAYDLIKPEAMLKFETRHTANYFERTRMIGTSYESRAKKLYFKYYDMAEEKFGEVDDWVYVYCANTALKRYYEGIR